jgi:nucleoside-diphosphate-sugar epimerase
MISPTKIMRILLTGCTGFVGKFALRELLERLPSDSQIICLLRGKKGLTAEARWASIKSNSLYHYSDFSKVSIKEGDLEHLDQITWSQNEEPDLILHCAANVKTLDTYENLYRDNVIGVDNLCQAALSWSCKRLILISTCYVHPKGSVGSSELLTKGLPRSVFTTDYTYTKYLGENLAQTFSDRLQISLLRLSCVGAPHGWLDAHPTPEAMAHLGILSLMLRGKLEHVRVPSTMNLSVIPVDITAKCIVDEVLDNSSDVIKVKQICPPLDSIWNLSMSKLCKTLMRLSPNLNLKIYESSQEVFERDLRTNLFSLFPWGAKNLIFHQEVNRFIDKFADGQAFESSVPAQYLSNPGNPISEESIYEQTCFYVARSNHQHLIEKGSPRTLIDVFWGQMPQHNIESHYIFREPLRFESKKAAEQRFFDCFASYRPCFSDPDTKAFYHDPKQGVSIGWTYEEAIRYKKPIQIELLGSYEGVTGMKFIIHHSTGDGLSYMRYVLARLDSITSDRPLQTKPTSSIKPRSLSFIQELWCFIYYFALLVRLIFSPSPAKPASSESRTVEMATTKIHKQEGKSFTTSLLKQSYPALRAALGRDTVVYCIPAAIEGLTQRGLSMPRNSFVPIILPWSPDGGDIQEQLLNSKAVKAISTLLINFVSLTDMTWIRDHFLDRIDVVFSSLLVSDTPLTLLKSTHFLSPTPSMIPFTISAGTLGPETHITVASSIEAVPASKLMNQILR